jgi:hypothetical protein
LTLNVKNNLLIRLCDQKPFVGEHTNSQAFLIQFSILVFIFILTISRVIKLPENFWEFYAKNKLKGGEVKRKSLIFQSLRKEKFYPKYLRRSK